MTGHSCAQRLAWLLLTTVLAGTDAFFAASASRRRGRPPRVEIAASASGDAASPSNSNSNAALKSELLERIRTLRSIQDRDGDFSIDFGVKGGELDKKSRAPQKVDFYSISDDAGRAADAVMDTATKLAKNNPTAEPTLYLGDDKRGGQSPLDGEWRLLFTTAADATFSKNSTRGDATAKNVVDARRGRITNVIDFARAQDGAEPLLRQLNVVIAARAAGRSRVELRFRYAKAVLTRFFGWRRRWSLYIPVPGPFVTRVIVLLSRVWRLGRDEKRVPPKAFFDVLFLDDQLRIHRTGEDNLFVQAKGAAWEEAQMLLA